MTDTPPWLSPAEQHGWRRFVRMREKLGERLSRALQAEFCLSAADYRVLVHLVDAPGGRLRPSDLARSVEWERSRMSHQVARMVKRGLVGREGCLRGGRAAFVVITPEGRTAIAEAAPRHVETVRRLFVDLLTPDELRTLARVSHRVIEQLEK
ncbi:MarR family winged helix-turn-helix transcriptional regulator [Streptomyces sp. DSM 3412]|uniref:MarR family winged helix-turn-helix transcriptional regulator n=1 Tax=Streptomyces gottesmaniae TaxID=3075518 RepID=A0ABU2YQ49_9ACTN|nr:MarR family winged helix-turn-helix transcriptional regulator [Streptomyces sp. DSM 3412]MDT0566205.1 MarR family winged helix-turn-helix transcriptional regulator [Streptomyces sp. DSM 3412]